MFGQRRATLVATGALLLATEGRAVAADCGSPIISTCINDDNFLPHAGPSRFLAVGGTETTERSRVGFGTVTTYLSRPIIIHLPSPGPGGSDAYGINDQVNTSFLFSYGVTRRLELDFTVPVTFGQGGAGTSPVTAVGPNDALTDTAIRDLRFGFAYALVPRERSAPQAPKAGARGPGNTWALTARMEVSAPTADSGQFAGEGAAVWMPSVAADYRHGRWFAGIEAGARLRPTQELVGARVGSQLMVALGAGADILKRELLSAMVEARALPTFDEQHEIQPTAAGFASAPNGKHIIPAEWAVSARTAPLFSGDLAIQLGGGGPIPFSGDAPITNPRFRFTLSLRYAPLGRDSDGDGVPDAEDQCPTVHGIAGNPAGEGCPRQATTERVDFSTQAPAPRSPRATSAPSRSGNPPESK